MSAHCSSGSPAGAGGKPAGKTPFIACDSTAPAATNCAGAAEAATAIVAGAAVAVTTAGAASTSAVAASGAAASIAARGAATGACTGGADSAAASPAALVMLDSTGSMVPTLAAAGAAAGLSK